MKAEEDTDLSKRALDELFHLTSLYRRQADFKKMMDFVARFRSYSPFNAMLIHVQKPGARFVAPAHRWNQEYKRTIKPGSRPLVILQPMGPVMFVFDISDTEGEPLPDDVINPFAVGGNQIGTKLPKTLDNCKKDGIKVHYASMGSQRAGSISTLETNDVHLVLNKVIPIRYSMELKQEASPEENYATLVHELGHLYCGHLGTPDPGWWPSRTGLTLPLRETEAESVAYLVCSRFGIKNPSEKYLAGYIDPDAAMPNISLGCIMKATGLIERMGKISVPFRKQRQKSDKA